MHRVVGVKYADLKVRCWTYSVYHFAVCSTGSNTSQLSQDWQRSFFLHGRIGNLFKSLHEKSVQCGIVFSLVLIRILQLKNYGLKSRAVSKIITKNATLFHLFRFSYNLTQLPTVKKSCDFAAYNIFSIKL